MRKWEINGKSRRHIAWPHDIVCSRWLARAASEIVTYAKQVTIFNQMVVVSNDQTRCLEVGVLTAHLVSNCRSVVFLSNGFLCLSHPGTLWAQKKVLNKILPRQLPTCPSRNKLDFCKNVPFFDKNRPWFRVLFIESVGVAPVEGAIGLP